MNDLLKNHFEEDRVNFKKIDESLGVLIDGQKKTHEFMENLGWLADASKGVGLLKRPVVWFVLFIAGLVAVTGGLKTILAWFAISKQ